LLPEASHCQ